MAEAVDRYRKVLGQVDPFADALADAFAELPAGRGRVMLETALESGIEAVDDPPQALLDFFAAVDEIPLWLDWDRLEHGGQVLLRAGFLGISVLSLYSLPLMYSSAGGTKPLVFTGHLLRRAPLRLAETARFVVSTCRVGGLRRHGEGFRITIKVRMMHAQVRRLLWRSGRWKPEWGQPINQMYMAGTNVALSVVPLDGLRRFGLHVGRAEAEALLHLWRYSGYLSGIDPKLLCSTEAEGWQLVKLIRQTEGPPDHDCKALIEAVMTASYLPQLEWMTFRSAASYDMSRTLIGNALANELGYPKPRFWRLTMVAAFPLMALFDLLQRFIPGARAWATRFGTRIWDGVIEQILAGAKAEFQAPARLDNPPAEEVHQ